jgi:hypothetical protein
VSEIERCLRELRRELRGESWRRRRRVLAEARDHLRCAVDDGLSEAEAVARLGIIAMGTMPPLSQKSNVRIVGCTVNLQRALVASPYQRWIDVYAKRVGRTFRFDRLVRGHARTAVPATNARVDSSGHLALSSHLLPATCAAGPIGTRVDGVRALPSRRSLRFGATTQLAAHPRARFIVSIRNTGGVPIQGAIASLEIGGQAHYGNAWWRSGPKVIARLEPGASVSLRFAPPALGHGVRLIRATTAAIACETKVADNSPAFRVLLK